MPTWAIAGKTTSPRRRLRSSSRENGRDHPGHLGTIPLRLETCSKVLRLPGNIAEKTSVGAVPLSSPNPLPDAFRSGTERSIPCGITIKGSNRGTADDHLPWHTIFVVDHTTGPSARSGVGMGVANRRPPPPRTGRRHDRVAQQGGDHSPQGGRAHSRSSPRADPARNPRDYRPIPRGPGRHTAPPSRRRERAA
jgi:hypothetical protein